MGYERRCALVEVAQRLAQFLTQRALAQGRCPGCLRSARCGVTSLERRESAQGGSKCALCCVQGGFIQLADEGVDAQAVEQ